MSHPVPTSREFRLRLGGQLRALRVERGVSLRAAATAAGIAAPTLCRLELGRTTTSIYTLVRLAAALQMDVATLVCCVLANPAPDPV